MTAQKMIYTLYVAFWISKQTKKRMDLKGHLVE